MEANLEEIPQQELDHYIRLFGDSSNVPKNRPVIYKTPRRWQHLEGLEHEFEPKLVSIGPFFYKKGNLKNMECHKIGYAKKFLARFTSGTIETNFKWFLTFFLGLDEEARAAYFEPIDIGKAEFAYIMTMDSLFLIEVLYRNYLDEIGPGEAIFKNAFFAKDLVRDMMLVGNQLPLSLIEKVFDLCFEGIDTPQLKDIALRFFAKWGPKDMLKIKKSSRRPGEHLLDFYLHELYVERPNHAGLTRPEDIAKAQAVIEAHIPSAMSLKEGGVKFKERVGRSTFLALSFSNGVFEIPQLVIEDLTVSVLRNFMIFEQCYEEMNAHVTSYINLMSDLMRSEDDVQLLVRRGIILIHPSVTVSVSSLFNDLRRGVPCGYNRYDEEFNKIINYTKTRRYRLRASLRHEHSSMWKVIA